MRCDLNNKINLDALFGRLTTFELDNYDNYIHSYSNLEFSFEAKVSLIRASWCLQIRFQGPKLKIRMSYRRKIPKLNRDNFEAWQELMKFHLETISDSSLKYLENAYKYPIGTLIMEQVFEKKNHNIMMIDIASALINVEFDEVKECATTHDMWTKLKF